MLIHSCQSQLYSHTQMQRFACGSRLVEHWTMIEKPPKKKYVNLPTLVFEPSTNPTDFQLDGNDL